MSAIRKAVFLIVMTVAFYALYKFWLIGFLEFTEDHALAFLVCIAIALLVVGPVKKEEG